MVMDDYAKGRKAADVATDARGRPGLSGPPMGKTSLFYDGFDARAEELRKDPRYAL